MAWIWMIGHRGDFSGRQISSLPSIHMTTHQDPRQGGMKCHQLPCTVLETDPVGDVEFPVGEEQRDEG